MKPEEVTGIVRDFDEPGTLAPTGLYLGGTKYMVIQGEPGAVIRGKKVAESDSNYLKTPFRVYAIRPSSWFLHFDSVCGYAL